MSLNTVMVCFTIYLRSQLVHPHPLGVRREPIDQDKMCVVDLEEVVVGEGVGEIHLPGDVNIRLKVDLAVMEM